MRKSLYNFPVLVVAINYNSFLMRFQKSCKIVCSFTKIRSSCYTVLNSFEMLGKAAKYRNIYTMNFKVSSDVCLM